MVWLEGFETVQEGGSILSGWMKGVVLCLAFSFQAREYSFLVIIFSFPRLDLLFLLGKKNKREGECVKICVRSEGIFPHKCSIPTIPVQASAG